MSKKDVFGGRYSYYAYTRKNIKSVFTKGMLFEGKNPDTLLCGTSRNEESYLRYLREKTKSWPLEFICIFKIPKHYFGDSVDGKKHPPMPIVRTEFDYIYGEKEYLIPNLVLGIYNTRTKEFHKNPFYDPVYDPNGLQFVDEQIINMCSRISKYALARRGIPYEVLKQQDELSGVFNSTIEYYNSLANQDTHPKNRTKSLT